MLEGMKIKNFTVFQDEQLSFSKGLNVILGENATGKTHLLKLPYSIMAASAAEGKKSNGTAPTKSVAEKLFADKFVGVFRPERLGRLTRRGRGRERCELEFRFQDKSLNCTLNFATHSKSEIKLDKLPARWQEKRPVYLPPRELMSIFPGFVSTYEAYYLEFEETYRDTCLLLGAPAAKGPREHDAGRFLIPLEKELNGKVVLEKNGRFYLKIKGGGKMEMHLVAEGFRKLCMLAHLISTGSLLDKGCLFWDEPESNLNSKIVKIIAKSILDLCMHDIQVFVATHSLFLLREFEILLSHRKYESIPQHYIGLKRTSDGIEIEQDNDIVGIQTLVTLDEELEQSDRFMEKVYEK